MMKERTKQIISYIKSNPDASYKKIASIFNCSTGFIGSLISYHNIPFRRVGRQFNEPEKLDISSGENRPRILAYRRDIYYSGTGCTAFENCEKCGFLECMVY